MISVKRASGEKKPTCSVFILRYYVHTVLRAHTHTHTHTQLKYVLTDSLNVICLRDSNIERLFSTL